VDARDVDAQARNRAGLSVSDALHGIPGLVARERQNLAQDLQLSIRGFGTRATFGIRGIRLLLDGMPLTMPDGQGQASNLPLSALSRVEVLRGPGALLYGNAAGGVLQAFTAGGREDPGTALQARAGSDALARQSVALRAAGDKLDAMVDLSRLQTDGYREHSRASRDLLHARLGVEHGPWRASLILNGMDQPLAEDPLGLDAAQLAADPRQAPAAALAFDTRKSVAHRQAGLVVEPTGGGEGWRLLAYGGTREVVQFLAVPIAAQANPKSGGGVVDLDSRFGGIDLRLGHGTELAGRTLRWVAGVAYDRQRQHRLGFENFRGSELGVRGALRRDQVDHVANRDAYLQADWALAPAWTLQAGLRRSDVRFRSDDAYIATGNPDDSGSRRFVATSPSISLGWQARGDLFVFATWGRGFETPTFDELGYRPDGSAGLNFALDASRNRGVEVGVRGRRGGWQWQLGLFDNRADAELVVVANSGGRSSYANAGAARRRGLELAVQWQVGSRWRHALAFTRLDARTLEPFLTCAGTPCPAPTVRVAAGPRLPGTARDQLWWASTRTAGRWEASLELEAVGPVTANSVGTARAAGYAVVDLALARDFGGGRRMFARIGNVFDRAYVGSVIVNEGNARYFEPAPGRQWLVGLDWRFR
jgi:iron complex outermembrane receptor protein